MIVPDLFFVVVVYGKSNSSPAKIHDFYGFQLLSIDFNGFPLISMDFNELYKISADFSEGALARHA